MLPSLICDVSVETAGPGGSVRIPFTLNLETEWELYLATKSWPSKLDELALVCLLSPYNTVLNELVVPSLL